MYRFALTASYVPWKASLIISSTNGVYLKLRKLDFMPSKSWNYKAWYFSTCRGSNMILLLGETIEFFQSFTASYRSYGNGTIAVLKGKRSNSADDRWNSESLFTLLMKFRCNEIGLCNAAWHFCLVTDVVRLLVGRNAPKMNQGFTPAHWVIRDMEAISH